MTINDFIYYAMDVEAVEIFDLTAGETVWKGYSDDIPDEYLGMEINTWNSLDNGICFNVEK